MKSAIIASLAALALGAAALASAEGAQEVIVKGSKTTGAQARTQTVNFADLNLTKPEGVQTLYTRIRGAASDVCAPAPADNDMPGKTDYRKCLSSAVDGAVGKVGNSGLSALAAKAAH